jgi:two-component system OmpR family sensor kinase
MRRWLRPVSLRARLLLVLVGVLAAALVVTDLVVYVELSPYLIGQVDQQLQDVSFDSVAHTVVDCAQYQSVDPTGRCPVPLGAGNLPAGDLAQLEVPGGGTVALSFGGQRSAFPRLPTTLPSTPFTASTASGVAYRVLAEPVHVPGVFGPATLLVAVPLSGVAHDVGHLLLVEVLVSAAALAGLGVLSGWLVRRELRPLRQMATTAGAIAAGDLSRRVPASEDRSEVGRLGLALNTMLGEIEAAFAASAASAEQLRRFLADASHELRTPLTSIRGYAEMFDRGVRDRPEDLALAMRHIRSEADRMAVLVEDLLLLARLGQQRPIASDPVDVAQVAAEAVVAARAAYPGRVIELRTPADPVVVVGDHGRLRQVVDNLVRNAITYAPPDEPVEVTVGRGPDAVDIVVADRGPGIAPEDRSRIFEAFQRLDPSRARATGGVGLGLAIVAAIVRAHGGSVLVEDRPGGGALFRVHLPQRWPSPPGTAPTGQGAMLARTSEPAPVGDAPVDRARSHRVPAEPVSAEPNGADPVRFEARSPGAAAAGAPDLASGEVPASAGGPPPTAATRPGASRSSG